jgi:hypothetical protein
MVHERELWFPGTPEFGLNAVLVVAPALLSHPRGTAMSDDVRALPDVLVTDRRGGDRRGNDRRKRSVPVAVERRSGQDRRQQGERRRQIDPTTCERDYNDEEIAFMKAMDQYKRDNRRPFPTWSEVLEVLHALGYRRVAEPTAMPGLQPGRNGD